MTEEHGDVRNVMRALDGVEFGYRTFGSAATRLPQATAAGPLGRAEPDAPEQSTPLIPSARSGLNHAGVPDGRADPPAPIEGEVRPSVAATVPARVDGAFDRRADVPDRQAMAVRPIKLSDVFQILSAR